MDVGDFDWSVDGCMGEGGCLKRYYEGWCGCSYVAKSMEGVVRCVCIKYHQ